MKINYTFVFIIHFLVSSSIFIMHNFQYKHVNEIDVFKVKTLNGLRYEF